MISINFNKIVKLSNGGHILYIYEDIECYINNAISYIVSGIELNQHILVVDTQERCAKIREKLIKFLSEKDLIMVHFVDNIDFYEINGNFDGESIIQHFSQLLDPFFKNHITIRTWAHVCWEEQDGIVAKLKQFEDRADCCVNDAGLVSVCAYDASTISSSLQLSMMRNHEYVLTDNEFVRSSLYINTKKDIIFPSISIQEKMEELSRQDLLETVRMQQGMIFKFKERSGRFIHTLCDGELLYRFGHSSEQIMGKELHEFLPYAYAETILQYYKRAWKGEENVTYEMEYNNIWFLVSLRPICNEGQVVEVIGSGVDITERKESQERYKSVVELSPKGIIIRYYNEIIYANPSAHNILKEEQLIGQNIQSFLDEDSVNLVKRRTEKLTRSETLPFVEMKAILKTEEIIYIDVTSAMIHFERKPAILTIFRDVTERKRNEELIQKVEKLSLAGQLASGVAHEIRNPLTSIKGFVQLLQKGGGNPFYVDTILSEIHRLEDIVTEFLMLAKPQPRQIEEVNIVLLLQQVITLFSSQTNLKNVEIVEKYVIDLPRIYCDENQIKQVFINIFKNAIEAMPNGGIITIQTLSHGTDSIQIRVVDQGCGITTERLKHLGEPFYSTKEKGTGLGLMISQTIIHDHGGTIHFESAINIGTTVDVILPITKSHLTNASTLA
ncbi:ATP-binding protein [Paenibacillus whitsoniae]|uniref:histidine kinase n=1 Tax=Paenibacillus whitsoniae TaxID=2496558 RepID=A0A430JJ11_9BACL|nr:ATP-binding protein [Paenibacillus whitsoniae]RTE11041.1 PAS domain S-box protein [Paenibacillus whitsoniae]